DMKDTKDDGSSVIPRKIIKLSREELEAEESGALVEKVLSLTDQLSQVTELAKTLKRRETQNRLQYLQKDKEVKDLIKERNDAYYSGVTTGSAQRDQLLDPFFYEAFIAMKEKIASKDKEIATLKETVKALESGKDAKILYQFLESKNAAMRKLREYEKNARKIGHLENRLALAHAALRAIRKEKKEHAHEITERDEKIAELEKELFHLRNDVTEEAVSEPTELEPDEEVKAEVEVEVEADANHKEQKPVIEEEEDDDVVVLDDSSGVDVDVSVLHRSGDESVVEGSSTSGEERCVSVGENGVLKITV
uniref:THO complex subunit 7 n=1 Tax=Haemonchus contortus TaxID=6289 RepID=A0A7I4XSC3_HAECO